MRIKKTLVHGALSALFAMTLGTALPAAAQEPVAMPAEAWSLLVPMQMAAELRAQGVVSPAATGSAPVTSGGIPLAAFIQTTKTTTAALVDFNSSFTQAEVTGYVKFLPLILTMISGTGAQQPQVTVYTPAQLAGIGDAQKVHQYAMSNVLGTVDSYMRGYASKVSGGPMGTNLRIDFWAFEEEDPEMYIGAVEIPQYLIDLFNSF